MYIYIIPMYIPMYTYIYVSQLDSTEKRCVLFESSTSILLLLLLLSSNSSNSYGKCEGEW